MSKLIATLVLLLIINQTVMNQLQLFALMQNQVMEIKFGHPIAVNARASNKAVLQAIGRIYKDNNMASKFNDYMVKFGMVEKYGIELV